MNKETVYIAGNSNNMWTKLFIEHVLLKNNYEIYVQRELSKNGEYHEFYLNNGVKYYADYRVHKSILSIPKIKSIATDYKKIHSIDNRLHFDKVFIIYTSITHIKCALRAADSTSKIYAIFLGSDLFRASEKKLKTMQKVFNTKKIRIVCVSDNLANFYNLRFRGVKSTIEDVIDFGDAQIPEIDKYIKDGYSSAKKRMGIHPDKITITIGYNAKPQQQHEAVVNSLSSFPHEVKERLFLILPMTYNGSELYINKIRRVLSNSGIEYKILNTYMNSSEMALLWVATDVLIHAQTTDALSFSMLEAIYAGCNVLNGSWLKYPEFEKWGIILPQFSSFVELREKIDSLVNTGIVRDRSSKDIIYKHASWETCEEKWKALLNTQV